MLEWGKDGFGLWARKSEASAKAFGAAHWEIGINLTILDASFFVVGHYGKFPSLADAKDWCEERERAAQPSEPKLPAVGSVWGVPGKPKTRRFVRNQACPDSVYFSCNERPQRRVLVADWHTWVRESEAVDLLADRAELVRRMEAVEKERDKYAEAMDKIISEGGTFTAPYTAREARKGGA